MKILKTVLAAAVTVTLLFSQVLAVESPVKGDGPKIISAITASGEDITDQMVSTRMGSSSSVDKINEYLSGARSDISAAGEKPGALKGTDGVALKATLQNALGSDANVDDAKFAEVFDVSWVKEGQVVQTGAVTVTVEWSPADGVALAALHSPYQGAWENVSYSRNGNTITLKLNSTSPVAFVTASKTPADGGNGGNGGNGGGKTTSPQTGEYVTKYILLAAAALMVAGVVCVRRAKKSSAK